MAAQLCILTAGPRDTLWGVVVCRSYVTPTDTEYIPTGAFEAVLGTPYDFEVDNSIGARINELNNVPIGYDINYVLFGLTGPESKAATINCNVVDEYAPLIHVQMQSAAETYSGALFHAASPQ